MAIQKLVNYQITAVRKEVSCHIQINSCSQPQILALGGRRCEAVSVQLCIYKKAHEIGFVPMYAYWDVIPLIENTFNLAFELGKQVGSSKSLSSYSELEFKDLP